ncbi:putative membrane protein, a component ofa putative membrane remodelling system [Halapricum desulfuricans]|uniref:Putative membrane protein, a component ofa putative membrane remodelling system n=1 Tax=Halapricum desulfuricans TaxID=2841257 RepID=A0A897NLG0_9EURY|nr:putative membrane protein, a component ofa putative membrane remodelling system [Halapricum desulfuricans]
MVLPLQIINYLRGINDRLISRESNVETATYLALSFVLIVVAAWIEATVSLSIAA